MPDSNKLSLAVCSRKDTVFYVDGNYSHVLSLLDPEKGYGGVRIPKKATKTELLMFHDIDDIEIHAPQYYGLHAPQEDDVANIIAYFTKAKDTNPMGFLVHCEAGISRSTAAAMIGLCVLGLSAEEAFRQVTAIAEDGLPNRRMLRMAGEMLGDDGVLLKMAEAHRRYLFDKHGQEDPTETLRQALSERNPMQRFFGRIHRWHKSPNRSFRKMSRR